MPPTPTEILVQTAPVTTWYLKDPLALEVELFKIDIAEGSCPQRTPLLEMMLFEVRLYINVYQRTLKLITYLFSDCTKPFEASFVTDALSDGTTTTIANGNAGLCLEYTQEPCANARAGSP